MKHSQPLSVEDILIYTITYRFSGFLGVIIDPNIFDEFYDSWFVKINKYYNTGPISFIILNNIHYTTVFINDEHIYYYDPLGYGPPEEYLDLIHKFAETIKNKPMTLIYNKSIHQGDTPNCGYFALKYLQSHYTNDLYFDWNTVKDDIEMGELVITNYKKNLI